MKKLAILLLAIAILTSCGNNKSNEGDVTVHDIHNPASADASRSAKISKDMPVMTFEKMTHDFGKVMQGEKLSYSFKFTNTGKSNLIIEETNSSCGCTTSTPPKAPIRPGESAEIKVSFNSANKEGPVTNSVVISANTYPVNTLLKVTANVIKP
jgi:hypothetical protein